MVFFVVFFIVFFAICRLISIRRIGLIVIVRIIWFLVVNVWLRFKFWWRFVWFPTLLKGIGWFVTTTWRLIPPPLSLSIAAFHLPIAWLTWFIAAVHFNWIQLNCDTPLAKLRARLMARGLTSVVEHAPSLRHTWSAFLLGSFPSSATWPLVPDGAISRGEFVLFAFVNGHGLDLG